jgi:hypothetical protein
MFRRGQTYDVLISRIAPSSATNGKRPALQSTTIFRADEGYLPADLVKRRGDQTEIEIPRFYSRGGEPLAVPTQFESVIKAATSGVLCLGCKHSHYLIAPEAASSSPTSQPNAKGRLTAIGAEDGGAEP